MASAVWSPALTSVVRTGFDVPRSNGGSAQRERLAGSSVLPQHCGKGGFLSSTSVLNFKCREVRSETIVSLSEDGKIQRATVSVGSRAQMRQFHRQQFVERELHRCLEAALETVQILGVTSAAKRQTRLKSHFTTKKQLLYDNVSG